MLLRAPGRAVNPACRDPALEPIAFTFEHEGVGLLEEPVDRGVGQDTVWECLAPFLDVAVGGQHECRAVLASIDQIEHLFGHFAGHRHRCPVVDDPQPAREHAFEELIEGAFGLGEADVLDPFLVCCPVDPVSTVRGCDPQGERHMRLAHSARAEEECDAVILDELEGGEFADLFLIDLGIEVEVKGLQRGGLWKARLLEAVTAGVEARLFAAMRC